MSPTLQKNSYLSNTLSHFWTFVWLRWRIRINQLRHGSSLGKALAAILLVSFALSCVGVLVFSVILGATVPRLIPRENYFLFWDGLSAIFCFVWVIHVATDVQRTDAITLDRILHLPVAFSQVFAINYLSFLMSMTLALMFVCCLGFMLGSCFAIGPIALLFLIPLVFFLLAVTALTYQLQGWLAALMSNPRRRQLIMILLPFCIIVISQLPTIVATRFARDESKLNRAREMLAPPVTVPSPALPPVPSPSELDTQAEPKLEDLEPVAPVPSLPSIDEDAEGAKESQLRIKALELARAEKQALWLGRIRLANLFFPPLWMAGCVESIVSGTFHAFWITGAMTLVGFASLRRNYYQTLRFYKGETDSRALLPQGLAADSNQKAIERLPAPTSHVRAVNKLLLVERHIPYVSEETAAIITMTLRSMSRAPEVKLYLLLPLIGPFVLFGVLQAVQLPKIDELKAAIIVGFSAFGLFVTSGMLGNTFAYDRAGFRAFVLSPIPRERILLGRNLATTPVLLLQTFLLAIAIGIYFGMTFDKLLCALFLSASLLPLFSLLTNLMSILTPFPLAAGSIQPKQFNLVPVLFSLVLSMFMPAITGLALIPLGIEWGIDRFFPNIAIIPIALLLSIPWLAASLFLYRWVLPWEGKLLANREKELLRIVTSKIE